MDPVAVNHAERVINSLTRGSHQDGWRLDVPVSPVMRYLCGEFTDGVIPREFPDHQEKIKNNVMVFFMVMELMAMLQDKGAPVDQEADKPRPPLTPAEKLRRGHYLPFSEVLIMDKPVVTCLDCHMGIDRELALTLIKAEQAKCPHCKSECPSSGGEL